MVKKPGGGVLFLSVKILLLIADSERMFIIINGVLQTT